MKAKAGRKGKPLGRPRTLGVSVPINVRLPVEEFAALSAEAQMTGKNVSELVREALAAKHETKPETKED